MSLRILVGGMVAGEPHQGGATWAALQYVLGLRRLGHDVVLVEPVGESFDPVYASAVVDAFGLFGSVAFTRDRETLLGVPFGQLVGGGYDLLVNLSGVVRDEELACRAPVRLFVDLDPAFTQLWHTDGVDVGLEGHTHFATVGLALGAPSCPVPLCGVEWIPTLPPVVLSHWPPSRSPGAAWTTVGNWRSYGPIDWNGTRLGQRAHSMRALLDLPARTGFAPEIALAIDPGEGADLAALTAAGWRLLDPVRVAGTPARYRAFVHCSRAELGVAKEGYVTTRCGWFSDRSACYLASGRPVVVQDTGLADAFPAGTGLLTYTELDDAVAAVQEVEARYRAHSEAARRLAAEHLDSGVVLCRLLERVGVA